MEEIQHLKIETATHIFPKFMCMQEDVFDSYMHSFFARADVGAGGVTDSSLVQSVRWIEPGCRDDRPGLPLTIGSPGLPLYLEQRQRSSWIKAKSLTAAKATFGTQFLKLFPYLGRCTNQAGPPKELRETCLLILTSIFPLPVDKKKILPPSFSPLYNHISTLIRLFDSVFFF
jgi:hypothetical protein